MRSSSARLSLAIGVALAVFLGTVSARADDPPRREIPDYDNREERGDDAVDVLLWIPRILTGPLYLVSEYLVREPLGALVTAIEQNEIVTLLMRVLTFGPERNIGVLLTGFYHFGFQPSVGIYAFWRDFLVRDNRISLHAATWGLDWLSLSIADRAQIDGIADVYLRGAFVRRPDFIVGARAFYPDAERTRLRYASESVDAELGYALHPLGRSIIAVSALARWARFDDTDFGGEPSMLDFAQQRALPTPAGFDAGYTMMSLRGHAAFDDRDPSGVPSAGVRIAVGGEVASTLAGGDVARWLGLSGDLALATDVLGGRRVLVLEAAASTLIPVAGAQVPFDRLIDAGGTGPLRGFLPGELLGGSALAMTLAYEWPVWLFLNARLYVSVGNAFDALLEGAAPERLRLAFGFALAPPVAGEHPFELGIGAGTDTFEQGASPSSFRFYVGARNGL